LLAGAGVALGVAGVSVFALFATPFFSTFFADFFDSAFSAEATLCLCVRLWPTEVWAAGADAVVDLVVVAAKAGAARPRMAMPVAMRETKFVMVVLLACRLPAVAGKVAVHGGQTGPGANLFTALQRHLDAVVALVDNFVSPGLPEPLGLHWFGQRSGRRSSRRRRRRGPCAYAAANLQAR